MGAPVFNTSYVGQGSRTAKHPVTTTKTSGFSDAYESGKHWYGVAATLYGAYKFGRELYPAIRAGMQAMPMVLG